MIDSENWNYTYFFNNQFKAFISVGGEHSSTLNDGDQIREIFFVNLSTLENQDVSQKKYLNLEDAICQINKQYRHWSFKNPLLNSGGCSTCSAH